MKNFISKFQPSWLIKRTLVVMVFAVVLTSLGIRASDRFFTASVREAAISSEECPSDMVLVSYSGGGFCIDKYENSPGTDCPFTDPKNETETRINIDDPSCEPVSEKGRAPWKNISQNQAALACAKAGKRLATAKEWFQAAMGTPDKESGWSEEDCQVDSNWESQPGPTGFGKACVSAAGAYDMIGNVWEWVEGTVFDGTYHDHQLPDQGFVQGVDEEGIPYETDFQDSSLNYHQDYFWIRTKGVRGLARGGYWDNGSDAGIYSTYLVVPPSFSGVGIGFRCVK